VADHHPIFIADRAHTAAATHSISALRVLQSPFCARPSAFMPFLNLRRAGRSAKSIFANY